MPSAEEPLDEVSAGDVTTRPPPPPPDRVPARGHGLHWRHQNIAFLLVSLVAAIGGSVLLAFAYNSDDESVSFLVAPIFFVMLAGVAGVICVFCRRHVALRRRAGYHNACFDCLDLRDPADPWNPESLAHLRQLRQVTSISDPQKMREELRVLSALAEIKSRPWGGGPVALECSLCCETVEEGAAIRQLRCAHAFHAKCIDKWLIHAQRGQPRRCPLCNADPLTGFGRLVTTTNGQSVFVEASPGGASTHDAESTDASSMAGSPNAHRSPSQAGGSQPGTTPRAASVWAERRQWMWHVVVGGDTGDVEAPPAPPSPSQSRIMPFGAPAADLPPAAAAPSPAASPPPPRTSGVPPMDV